MSIKEYEKGQELYLGYNSATHVSLSADGRFAYGSWASTFGAARNACLAEYRRTASGSWEQKNASIMCCPYTSKGSNDESKNDEARIQSFRLSMRGTMVAACDNGLERDTKGIEGKRFNVLVATKLDDDGHWTQQVEICSDETSSFVVDIADDGQTLVVGSQSTGASVYTLIDGKWTQEETSLAETATTVALSRDGNNLVLIELDGTVLMCHRETPGAKWTLQRHTGTSARYAAISGDGSTCMLGVTDAGKVLVFERHKLIHHNWELKHIIVLDEKQGSKLNGFVSLSGEGDVALVCGQTFSPPRTDEHGLAACWIFAKESRGWVQQGPAYVASPGNSDDDWEERGYFSTSAFLLGDASGFIIGGHCPGGDEDSAGFADVYRQKSEEDYSIAFAK